MNKYREEIKDFLDPLEENEVITFCDIDVKILNKNELIAIIHTILNMVQKLEEKGEWLYLGKGNFWT